MLSLLRLHSTLEFRSFSICISYNNRKYFKNHIHLFRVNSWEILKVFSSIRESLLSMQMSTELSDKSFIVETKCNRLKTANSLLSGTVGIGWGGLKTQFAASLPGVAWSNDP